MDVSIIISLVGLLISILSCLIEFILLEYLLNKNKPRKYILLFSIIPGLFLTSGLIIALLGMGINSEQGIPILFYLFCGLSSVVIYIILTVSYGLFYSKRPKNYPLIRIINQFRKGK